MQKRTTLKQLSELMNVSISTVSKSLSDSSEISVETRDKVKKMAAKFNYRPNFIAKSIRSGQSFCIGVVIPNVINPFFSEILTSLEGYLSKNGFAIVTSISNESRVKEAKCLEMLLDRRVDGIVMCLAKETLLDNSFKHFHNIIELGLPMVLFDRTKDNIPCDKVVTNDFEAALKATEYLIKIRKCKNLIMVSTIGHLQNGELRALGYKKSIEKHKSKINSYGYLSKREAGKFKIAFDAILNETNIDGILVANGQALSLVHDFFNFSSKKYKLPVITAFCDSLQWKSSSELIRIDQQASIIGINCAKAVIKRIDDTSSSNYCTKTIKANLI